MRARLQERCAVVRREHVHRREDQPVERIVLDVALCGACGGAVGGCKGVRGCAAPVDERWMGGGRPTAAAVLGNAADGRRPVPSVSPTPTVRAGGPCVPSSPSQSTPRPGTARPGTPRRGAGKVQRCSGLCAVMQRGASRAEIARVVQQGHCARVAGRWGEGAQVSWLLCAERALNGKMSEASLMSFASTLRRGNFSAHSSSAWPL